MNKTKSTLLATVFLAAITLLPMSAFAASPSFRSDISCQNWGGVSKSYPLLGGGTYTQTYHRFKVYAGGNAGHAFLDFWQSSNSTPSNALYNAQQNNLGLFCADGNYDTIRARAGMASVGGSEGASWNWVVDSSNGAGIDWDKWAANTMSTATGQSDGAVYTFSWSSNDNLTGINYTYSWWNNTTPLYVYNSRAMYHYGASRNSGGNLYPFQWGVVYFSWLQQTSGSSRFSLHK